MNAEEIYDKVFEELPVPNNSPNDRIKRGIELGIAEGRNSRRCGFHPNREISHCISCIDEEQFKYQQFGEKKGRRELAGEAEGRLRILTHTRGYSSDSFLEAGLREIEEWLKKETARADTRTSADASAKAVGKDGESSLTRAEKSGQVGNPDEVSEGLGKPVAPAQTTPSPITAADVFESIATQVQQDRNFRDDAGKSEWERLTEAARLGAESVHNEIQKAAKGGPLPFFLLDFSVKMSKDRDTEIIGKLRRMAGKNLHPADSLVLLAIAASIKKGDI